MLTAVLALPGTLLVIVGGAIFSLAWGTVWSVLGATLGAIAAFWLARYCLRQWLTERLRHHRAGRMIHWVQGWSDRQALTYVLTLRLTPISPFCLVNILLGLTPMGLKPYALGTLVGITPGTLIYTWLGVAGHQALDGHGFGSMVGVGVALMGLSVLPVLWRRSRATPKP